MANTTIPAVGQFSTIAARVTTRFNSLAKSADELYIADFDKDVLYQLYLDSFPEGTNPMFRQKTDHDCSCCKQFIRGLGAVVAIGDGKVQTVWDIKDAEEPYATVIAALDEYVRSLPIRSIFRTKEGQYGVPYNIEQREDGSTHKWHHFSGVVPAKCRANDADSLCGEARNIFGVFKRGLDELKYASLLEVQGLIADNAIYRGQEFAKNVQGFIQLWQGYDKQPTLRGKELFVWENHKNPNSRFRNTVIGTLVQDLSEGVDVEAAVKMFESKVAPTNYKRPKSLITPRMIENAMTAIRELDLEDFLERRHAKPSDIDVNRGLFVDNKTKGKMKGGVEDLLMAVAKVEAPKLEHATEVSIDDFIKGVLPTATSIDLLVDNSMIPNFVSLTAPAHSGPGKLLKWDNDFAWSYSGNVADSMMRQQVEALGGRVTGPFRFSHSWNYRERNASLMDLHVFMPGSSVSCKDGNNDIYGNARRIGWNRRSDSLSQGSQDVDYTAAAPEGYVPVENIAFPSLNKMPEGDYICKIHNWQLREPTNGGFKAEIEIGGQLFQYERVEPLKYKQWVTVAVVTLKDGQFSIEHKLQPGHAAREVWGVKTESLVKVSIITTSPNYWDDNATGNKHYFFMLDGCLNPEPIRGLYNEFLNPRLEQHRKVFEVLGDRLKVQPTAEQLSGVGFSSTKADKAKVLVTARNSARRAYNIVF